MSWGIETKVPLWYVSGMQGTVDFWEWEKPRLTVVDYKSGRNAVDPMRNPQVMIYASALIDHLGIRDEVETIRLGIHQPFRGGFGAREPIWWEYDADTDLRFRHEVMLLAHETVDPLLRARLVTGDEQCKYCAAAPVCPARKAELMLGMYGDQEPLSLAEQFDVMDVAGRVRTFLDRVEDMMKELPDDVLRANGWRLKPGNRRFQWAVEPTVLFGHLASFGVDLYKQVMKTPAQVRDELGGDEHLSGLYEVEFNQPSLVKMRDKGDE